MKTDQLALIITVIIFIITTIFNIIYIIDDRRKRWYIDIIINSNLNKIDLFFKEILTEFKKAHEGLLKKHKKKTNNYLIEKAQKTQELHNIKKKFVFDIIPFFKSYDFLLSEQLKTQLLEFQDIYTNNLGIENSKDSEELVNLLEESKRSFYEIIYSPIKEPFNKKFKISNENTLLYLLILFFIIVFLYK